MLGAYLARVAPLSWAWGSHDCCTFVADWLVEVGYPDPMAFIRGTYDDEAGADAALKRRGLLRLASRGFDGAGLERVTEYLSGDVGIIYRTVDGKKLEPVMAIYSSGRWISLADQGLVADHEATPVRAWRVEWARP